MDVAELEPAEGCRGNAFGALLVDVREAHERALGMSRRRARHRAGRTGRSAGVAAGRECRHPC